MEFVATVALNTLLPKLTQLLQDEYNLHKGVKKNIRFLSEELETMHAALRTVGEVPKEQLDELKRIWARDVRDLSYDTEDIVDTFMVRVEGPDRPSKNSTKKLFKKMIKMFTTITTRGEVAKEIKDVRERIKDVAERRDRYIVNASTPTKCSFDPRITALYAKVTELVGIGEAKAEVITRLKMGDDDQQQRRIISIAGFGGLGKTTLAKAVHDEIKGQFNCTAFVSVSRNPDIVKVLKDILYELDNEKFRNIPGENLDETKLIDLARKFLQNKRYLIVIDDIWDIEPWKIIELALIENNMGSRIISTTRNIGVAEQVGGYYGLKRLSDESSETLFYGRIFGSKYCPGQFLEVSKKILKKCGGVPLAIITTSSLLANKSGSVKDWDDVCKSIGSGLGSNPTMVSMRKILLLSYYDLPSHLKACLLYLSIFPEDYVISKDRLIWRWVAEGFVQEQGDQSSLEIGESYFTELLNRSLIQPADMDDLDGTCDACRVHDTVLDLISSLSKEECFISTVLDDNGRHNTSSTGSKVRRLSLHNNTTLPTMMNTQKLRSLIIFKSYFVAIDDWMPSLSCYHLLRVLDLRDCKLEDLASLGVVGSLSHLRYLGGPSIDNRYPFDRIRLPVDIGKLQFLQILDLGRTAIYELPSSITGLTKLMCLRCHYRTSLPDGLKNLTSLEVLQSATVSSKSTVEELGHLTQLRVLDVKLSLFFSADDILWYKALVESLGKLNKIESLSIDYRYNDEHVDGPEMKPLGNLRRLVINSGNNKVMPKWIRPASLPVLSYLDIYVTCEKSEVIRVLGTLPCLRHLRFGSMYTPKEKGMARCEVGPDAFPCLVKCRFLCTFDVQKAEHVVVPSTFPRGAMPRLQHLSFWINMHDFCPSVGGGLTVDDLVLAHLPSLRSASVCIFGICMGADSDDEEGQSYVRENNEQWEAVRAKLEHEAADHPNNPIINFD